MALIYFTRHIHCLIPVVQTRRGAISDFKRRLKYWSSWGMGLRLQLACKFTRTNTVHTSQLHTHWFRQADWSWWLALRRICASSPYKCPFRRIVAQLSPLSLRCFTTFVLSCLNCSFLLFLVVQLAMRCQLNVANNHFDWEWFRSTNTSDNIVILSCTDLPSLTHSAWVSRNLIPSHALTLG